VAPEGVTVTEWVEAATDDPAMDEPTIALLMAEYADYDTGMHCFPSQATLAAEMGWTSTRQVRNCLGWLEVAGWVHDTSIPRGPVPTVLGGLNLHAQRLEIPQRTNENGHDRFVARVGSLNVTGHQVPD
jgi:hypothetical protein